MLKCVLTAFVSAFLAISLAAALEPDASADAAGAAGPAGTLEATADALDRAARSIDRAAFDPSALAVKLSDASPEAVRDWVGRNIAPLAYRGMLKGPAGTLMDRRGNSLDRALLLAAILKAKGAEVRLAHATLDDAVAAKLLDPVLAAAPPPAPPPTNDPAAVEAYLADPRIDGAAARMKMDLRKDAAAKTDQAAKVLEDSVRAGLEPLAASAKAESDRAAREARALEALKDHWWVQISTDGRWTDLDPFGVIVGTISPAQTMAPDAIPDDAKHRVTARVIAEYWDNGSYREVLLLSHSADTAALAGRPLVLTHNALRLPAPAGIEAGADYDASVATAAGAVRAWVPVLRDEEPVTDLLVDVSGETPKASSEEIAKRGGGQDSAGAVGGILGDAMNWDETDENAGPVRFTAEWVEVEITGLGSAAQTTRRAVFDLAGPAARANPATPPDVSEAARVQRGLAMIDSFDILVVTGEITAPFIDAQIASTLPALLRVTAKWITAPGDRALPDVPAKFRTLNIPPLLFATPRGRGNVVTPNVVIYRSGLRRGVDGALHDSAQIDVLANPTNQPLTEADPWLAALRVGVADTVAEHAALGMPAESHNAAARFASSGPDSWTFIPAGDSAALAALAWPEPAAAHDVAQGYALIAMRQVQSPDDAAWFRVNPATGETLGMTVRGGSEVAEEVSVTQIALIVGTVHSCGYKAGKAIAKGEMDAAKGLAVGVCLAGAIAFRYNADAVGALLSIGGNIID